MDKEFISRFIERLPHKEKEILKSYFETFLEGYPKGNMSVVAKRFGISRQWVDQVLDSIYEEFYNEVGGDINKYKSLLKELDDNTIEKFFLRAVINKYSPKCSIGKAREFICPVCNCSIEPNEICNVCESILLVECNKFSSKEILNYVKDHSFKAFKKDGQPYMFVIVRFRKSFVRNLSLPRAVSKEQGKHLIHAFLKMPEKEVKKYCSYSYKDKEIELKDVQLYISGFNEIIGYIKLRRENVGIKKCFLLFVLDKMEKNKNFGG